MAWKCSIVASAALALASCSGGEDAPSESKEQAAQAVLASLPAPYNEADLENGKNQFVQCRACHTTAANGPNLVGPNLHGVFSRNIGSKPGYSYSKAAQAAGWRWDPARLDAWLLDPRGYLPGTKMAFPGVKDEKNRRDLIAFVLAETGYGAAPAAPAQ